MSDQLIEKLGEDDTWAIIRENQIGRIASAREGAPDIFPVSYLVSDWEIFFRTRLGSRLQRETQDRLVAFEAASQTPTTFSSAVCLGVLSNVTDAAQITALEQLVIVNFSHEVEYVWMKLTPNEVRGRRLSVLGTANDR